MAALGCVDLVTWFDEDTPIARILECQPDVLVKGRRLAGGAHRRRAETRARGGTVHSIPFEHQRFDDGAARQDPPALKASKPNMVLFCYSVFD